MKRINVIVLLVFILTSCNNGPDIVENEVADENIVNYDLIITELEDEIQGLNDVISSLTEENEDQAEITRELEEIIEETKAKLQDAMAEKANLKLQISNHDSVIDKYEEDIAHLNEQIEQYGERIASDYHGLYIEEAISGATDTIFNPFFLSYQTGWYTFEGYAFGGYYDGKWHGIEDFEISDNGESKVIDLYKGNEVYTVATFDKVIGTYESSYPEHSIDHTAGYAFDTFNYPVDEYEEYGLVVGISGDWNPLPRIPRVSDDGNRVEVDIDGDGIVEVLEKNLFDNGEVEFVWYLVNGENETVVLSQEQGAWLDFMFADLNGDNSLEIISIGGWHGTSMNVFEFKYGRFIGVGSLYIGD